MELLHARINYRSRYRIIRDCCCLPGHRKRAGIVAGGAEESPENLKIARTFSDKYHDSLNFNARTRVCNASVITR